MHTTVISISLVMLMSLLSGENAFNRGSKIIDPRGSYNACGEKSYAFIHKEGFYSMKSKYRKLTIEEKNKICKERNYKQQ